MVIVNEIYHNVKPIVVVPFSDGQDQAAMCPDLSDLDQAAEHASDGLQLWQKAQDTLQMTFSLESLALIAAVRGDPWSAARIVGNVDAQREGVEYNGDYYEIWVQERLAAALRERLSEAEMVKFAAEGASWPEEQVMEAAARV